MMLVVENKHYAAAREPTLWCRRNTLLFYQTRSHVKQWVSSACNSELGLSAQSIQAPGFRPQTT